ncbi:TPA: DNA repair protein RadA [Candidatus Marinimicrobia bacterium]|nr:MAG: DNA repair protein radA [Marinimicrobia bacterium 46_47]KUK90520.1 MAG: DNA repair protein RadA [Marinimicrobia bacterium 46_43]HAE86625.1 DNA repair protein RadA [Candidatus Neomarinimicrobiota bacterium]HBY18100.1 DNA repair protein RadA [Candidatus Neomarinimicrobiota bacterium]
MPKKTKIIYICSNCGAEFPKWMGQCPQCGEWNTLEEKISAPESMLQKRTSKAGKSTFHLINTGEDARRFATGIPELDRVLGGGFLEGSIVLLGGDPGIGKSTLALQLLNELVKKHRFQAVYFSGEESIRQLALRARRLNIDNDRFMLSNDVELNAILNGLAEQKPRFVIFDSIQTLYTRDAEALPGSITQIRECASSLMSFGKQFNITIILIGHITKSGGIAGPKMLEHLVDTVLYMEGDQNNFFRILRSVKNRFGSTNEVGIFEMKSSGLESVGNPSDIFLSERRDGASGSVVACGLESTRPLLVEVQALTAKATFGTPQRNANGIDNRRLSMLLAVAERQLGLPAGMHDVFVNVVGGLKFPEPAMDLPVLIAIVSSLKNVTVPYKAVFMGEVGLTGEIRSVSHVARRVTEAERMGFEEIYLPRASQKALKDVNPSLHLSYVRDIQSLTGRLFG